MKRPTKQTTMEVMNEHYMMVGKAIKAASGMTEDKRNDVATVQINGIANAAALAAITMGVDMASWMTLAVGAYSNMSELRDRADNFINHPKETVH